MKSELIGLDALIYDGNATRGTIVDIEGDNVEVLTDAGTYIASIVQFFDDEVLDQIIKNKPKGISEKEWLLFHMTLTTLTEEDGSCSYQRGYRNGSTNYSYYDGKYKIKAFIDDKLRRI